MKGVKVFLLVLFGLICISSINAAGMGICLEAHVTDISPTSINIGDEFTVGIEIENCGYDSPNYVTFELKDISPYLEITDPLKRDIGKISYSNSNRFLVYHIKVKDNAVPGIYQLNYELIYGGSSNSSVKSIGKIDINLVGKEAKLNIASSKTKPILPKEGDTVELTLRIENYGDGDANSVRVQLDHKFDGTKEAFIGTLNPDEDGPAVFNFVVNKKGEYNLPVTITYNDDFGDNIVKTSVNLVVIKPSANIGTIIMSILVMIAFGGSLYYLINTNKKKDNVIKQLLNNNNNKPVKKKKNAQ
ncbi:MAG: hypothetical protein PHF86_09030 [Candidatus Nanoarchaeia archaeon]|nr:hypothetical protein [Candidatus Nanoarchaeia archaeon]